MRFHVSHYTENELALTLLKDQEKGFEVSVIPSIGALLHSFSIKTTAGQINIIDNYKSLDNLKKTMRSVHKSSKLSPFVCRIQDGKYHYNNQELEFMEKFPDGSAIHGILFDRPFEITDEIAAENEASVTMQYRYKADNKGYPFHYNCLVKYHLKENGRLQIETAVLNTGKEDIPISDGWHPYFTMGGKLDNWELSFKASKMVEFDQKLIPTGKLIPNQQFLKSEKIAETFLDNCFLIDNPNGESACRLLNPDNGLELSFYPDKHYPFLQIYTPPHRESIAIENLSSAPDAFNNKMGLTILAPGHSQTFTIGYQLSKRAV